MPLEEMKYFILERIEIIKNYDLRKNKIELKDNDSIEDYSINRSFLGVPLPTLKIEISQSW